jgi:leader peptidase (prepilin peptidase)/N-methyltransferase
MAADSAVAVFNPWIPWIALVLGLVLGSFYNVCVHRYLTSESIVFPGSKCPHCGHPLSWWENIPVLSFALLLGRCRACKGPISPRYLVVELFSGLWAFGLAWKFGMSWAFGVHMVVGGILIVASFIDFAEYILPDVLVLPGAVIAFLGAVFLLGLPARDSLIGAAAGGGGFLALQQGYRLLKGREGLGSGDVKLMVMLGAWVGWMGLPLAITAGAVCALLGSAIYMARQKQGMKTMVPFGPFLSLGAMLYILFGELYWEWLL